MPHIIWYSVHYFPAGTGIYFIWNFPSIHVISSPGPSQMAPSQVRTKEEANIDDILSVGCDPSITTTPISGRLLFQHSYRRKGDNEARHRHFLQLSPDDVAPRSRLQWSLYKVRGILKPPSLEENRFPVWDWPHKWSQNPIVTSPLKYAM